jgi:hypothetical protein
MSTAKLDDIKVILQQAGTPKYDGSIPVFLAYLVKISLRYDSGGRYKPSNSLMKFNFAILNFARFNDQQAWLRLFADEFRQCSWSPPSRRLSVR